MRITLSFLICLCIAVSAISGPGCHSETSTENDMLIFDDKCSTDSECLPLGVCIAGKCGKECTKDENCQAGEECRLYRCEEPEGIPDVAAQPDRVGPTDTSPDVGVACTKHVECDPYDMACIDGFCDRECTKDWHCEGDNPVCLGYLCKPADGPVDVVVDDGNPPGPDVVEEVDVLPEGCDPNDGPYGAACSCKQECASALCIQNKITMAGMCTQYCQNPAQCPGPDICIPFDAVSICIVNDSGQSTSCDPNEALCYSGDYLQNKLGQCACTTKCNKAVDCPEGFACHFMGVDKYCVDTGQNCSSDYNPCYGQCAGNPQVGVGFCTGLCITSADCPSGWTCQPIGEGLSVCASPF